MIDNARRSVSSVLSLLVLVAAPACGDFESVESSSADLASAALPEAVASTPGLTLSVHTTLGIPEAASTSDPQHYLLVKPQYVTSFDGHRKNPRWTSWELTSAWIGSSGRSPSFKPDSLLPSSVPQSSDADYKNSGFERGHICPSGDRTISPTDNQATFVFTNVVPQTNASNTGTWESLETYERTLSSAGHHLFVVAGSIYGDSRTIGSGVAVPTSMFKVVVVMDGAHPTPADVTAQTRVLSVEIPNTTTVSGSYTQYKTTFGDLERKTGFKFLSDVDPQVHDALASHTDGQ